MKFTTGSRARPFFTAILASGLFLSGCAASLPAPTSSLDAAQAAVVSAERFDAGRFAAAELGDARQRLAQANTAVQAERMELAGRLALEAKIAADLAYARTELAKATAINAEMQRGSDALTEEMDRMGDQQ